MLLHLGKFLQAISSVVEEGEGIIRLKEEVRFKGR
jgi:hypothetical protein